MAPGQDRDARMKHGTKVATRLRSQEITKLESEGSMKFQKMIRMQVMLMGLGAALLLASSAHAQQDMDPTDFPVNPGTPQSAKVAVARTAPAAAAKEVDSNAMVSASLWSNQDTKQEADLNRLAIVDATMVVILMVGTSLIVLYAMAATKRERRLKISPESASYTPASGATAH
jgi:hypothetical protein